MYYFSNNNILHTFTEPLQRTEIQQPSYMLVPVIIREQQGREPFALEIQGRFAYDLYNLEDGLKRIFKNMDSRAFLQFLERAHAEYEQWHEDAINILTFATENPELVQRIMRYSRYTGNYLQLASNTDEDLPIVKYLPKSRYHRTLTPWPATGKVTMRFPAFIRKVATEQGLILTDSRLEEIANRMKLFYRDEAITVTEHTGSTLRNLYHYSSHSRVFDLGDLRNSCMRHDNCRDFFGLYESNADRVSLLVARREGDKGLIGRALVWKLDNGVRALDRIYGSIVTQRMIARYAREHDIQPREYLEGKEGIVTLSNPEQVYYPYLDTLYMYDIKLKQYINNSVYLEREAEFRKDMSSWGRGEHRFRMHRNPHGMFVYV